MKKTKAKNDRYIVLQDAMMYSLAGAFSALVPLALLPILTRTLSITDYAYYVLISSAIGLIVPFIGFGTSNAVVVRYFTMDASGFKIYLSTVLRILVISGAIFVSSIALLRDVVTVVFEPGLLFLAFAIFIALLSAISLLFGSLYIAAANAAGYLRAYSAFGLSLFFSTLIMCGVFELGLIGACMGMVIGYTVFAVVACSGSPIVSLGGDWSSLHAGNAMVFGYPLMLHSVAVGLMTFSDRFAVSHWVGTDAVAAYGVTVQLALIVGYFFHAINKVIQPRMYALLRIGGRHEQRLAVLYVAMQCLAVIAISSMYALLLPHLTFWFAGGDYSVAPVVYLFVVLGGAFNSMYLGFAHFIFFNEKTFKLSFITFISAIGYIGCLTFFAPRYGLEGVAVSFALANGMMLFLAAILARMCTDIDWFDMSVLTAWRDRAT